MSCGNNFSDDEQPDDGQTGDVQPSENIELSGHDQPADEEPFINLADSTSSGSSDVIITHTSTLEPDINKKFWDRLAGIYINLELLKPPKT